MSKLLALIIIIKSRGGQLRNFGLSIKFVNLRIYVQSMPTDKIAQKPQNSLIASSIHTKWQSLM